MTKKVFMWPTCFLALLASAAALLPGVVHRQPSIVFPSPRRSMGWSLSMMQGRDEENESFVESSDENAITVASDSRRSFFRSALVSTLGIIGFEPNPLFDPQSNVAYAYTIERVDPNENDIYAEAQNMPGHLKVLWVGSGALKAKGGETFTGGAESGVYKNLFKAGNEVIALDLLQATDSDYRKAKQYAKEQGYSLRYQQGDATKLGYADETFDAVVCSCFLSQPFDPLVVVNEIHRVLKPGGRFGFFEHKTDIDTIVVGKVFGEASIIKLVAYPEMQNILAGVVRKV